jgi:hypothetical protein
MKKKSHPSLRNDVCTSLKNEIKKLSKINYTVSQTDNTGVFQVGLGTIVRTVHIYISKRKRPASLKKKLQTSYTKTTYIHQKEKDVHLFEKPFTYLKKRLCTSHKKK